MVPHFDHGTAANLTYLLLTVGLRSRKGIASDHQPPAPLAALS